MSYTIKAIETRYAGHLFRSRLEARWAAMFDLLGWQWTYEPFDLNGWVPDFLLAPLTSEGSEVLVEVKGPDSEWDAAKEKIEQAIGDDSQCLLAGPELWRFSPHAIGELGKRISGESKTIWDRGVLCRVTLEDFEREYDLCQAEQSYRCQLTGFHDSRVQPLEVEGVETLEEATAIVRAIWGQAHQRTRYSPR